MDKVIVSCIQFAYKSINTFEDFANNIENLLRQTKDSHFVVFPETFTFELLYLLPNYNISRISEFTNKYVELFSELSSDYDQYIVAGSHLAIEEANTYNMCHLFSPNGTIFKHRKTHLFPLERQMGVMSGDALETFKSKFGEIAIAICYEMEFPEVARVLTLKGADIIFCPSYTVGEHGFWRVRHCCQARAIENQIYVVHSCMVGHSPLGGIEGWGKSSICSPCEPPWNPNGIIVEANTNTEEIITAELDFKILKKKRRKGAAPTLKDRRVDIYNIQF